MDFLGASLALFDADRVLLIKRARAPFLHYWTLPGGGREGDETAEQCAVREFFEETGLRVAAARPVTVVDIGETGRPYGLAVFTSRTFSGEPRFSDEIADHAWLRPEAWGDRLVTPELADVLAEARRVLAAEVEGR